MLFFMITRFFLTLGAFLRLVQCQPYFPTSTYALSNVYDEKNFFREFQFFTAKDPTHGFVEYVDGLTAEDAGLAGISDTGGVFMGVDDGTESPTSGRKSVRLTSSQAFTHGLFIADIAHMPGKACGVWPAFWMFGNDWPDQGEIDIIEGVSNQLSNQVTLHTDPGCSVTNDDGALLDCHAGCSQETSDITNYGDTFNEVGGGVYATEWTSSHIAIWFFPRSRIPSDITSGKPEPDSWAAPMARFYGGQSCNLDQHFQSNNLVFDTTFCGTWAGNASSWDTDGICSTLSPTCEEYVSAHPEAFSEAYWLVNSIKIYNAITRS